LASSCKPYHFGGPWCISIQNHFGHATDHTRERWAQLHNMDINEINEIIKKGKISLSLWDKFDHYSSGFFPLILCSLSAYAFFDNNYDLFFLILAILLLIPSLIILLYQGDKQLKLTKIITDLDSIAKNHDLTVQTFKDLEWEIKEDNNQFVAAYRKWYKFLNFGKGQMISVFIDKNSIYVISLFYPSTHAALLSGNRNDININVFGNTFINLKNKEKISN
jgi:hypothetical protein